MVDKDKLIEHMKLVRRAIKASDFSFQGQQPAQDVLLEQIEDNYRAALEASKQEAQLRELECPPDPETVERQLGQEAQGGQVPVFTIEDPDLDALLNAAHWMNQPGANMDNGVEFLTALEQVQKRLATTPATPAQAEQKPAVIVSVSRPSHSTTVQDVKWLRDFPEGETPLYTAPQPEQVAQDKPDMFWNDADPEMAEGSIHDVIDREWGDGSVTVGDVMEIQQAIRLPNIKVRLIESAEDGPDYFDYEVIEDGHAARTRDAGGSAV